MKTAISLPDPLLRKANNISHDMGISLNQLLILAVSRYIQKVRRNHVTKQLNKVYETGKCRNSLIPKAVEAMQFLAINKHAK
jgi:hypothetical protein